MDPRASAHQGRDARSLASMCNAGEHGLVHMPHTCPLQDILRYPQYLFDAGRAASTLKVYVAAISFNHGHIVGRPVRGHYWLTQFLHGTRRLRPPRIRHAAALDLPLVLQAPGESHFEPMAGVTLRNASMKTAFHLAITTAKHVSDLTDGSGVTLWPNIAFLPKVLSPNHVNRAIELGPYHPPPFSSQLEESQFAVPSPSAAAVF